MSDFVCKEAKDMYYTELASGVKHFKEEEGRELMCQAVEEYAKKKANVNVFEHKDWNKISTRIDALK